MSEFPVNDVIFNRDASFVAKDAVVEFEKWLNATKQLPGAMPPETITISNLSISPTTSHSLIAGSDTNYIIQTITIGTMHNGAIIYLSAASAGYTIVLRSGGNISTTSEVPLSTETWISLQRVNDSWHPIKMEASNTLLLEAHKVDALAHKPLFDEVKTSITALQDEATAKWILLNNAENAINNLTPRVTAVETATSNNAALIAGHETRIETLEEGGGGTGGGIPATRTISTTAPLSGGGDLSANRTLSIATATSSAIGAVQLSTTAEATTGTDTTKAVTPAGVAAHVSSKTSGLATDASVTALTTRIGSLETTSTEHETRITTLEESSGVDPEEMEAALAPIKTRVTKIETDLSWPPEHSDIATVSGNIDFINEEVRGSLEQIIGGEASVVGGGVPVGIEAWFSGTTAPTGWLDESLNHGELQRTAYPELWSFAAASGNILSDTDWQAQVDAQGSCGAFSTGDGTATFRIPLLRRVFPRARDVDGGLDVGMWQGDAIQQITGVLSHFVGAGAGYEGSGAFGLDTSQSIGRVYSPVAAAGYAVTFDSSNVARTADETRPVSIVRLPIIKAWDVANIPATIEVGEIVNQISSVSDRVNNEAHIREMAGNRVWTSAEYTPISGTPTIISHGIENINLDNARVEVWLKCVVAQHEYSVGDTVRQFVTVGGSSYIQPGLMLTKDVVRITTGNTTAGNLNVVNKNTGAAGPITSSQLVNWRYIFKIWY